LFAKTAASSNMAYVKTEPNSVKTWTISGLWRLKKKRKKEKIKGYAERSMIRLQHVDHGNLN